MRTPGRRSVRTFCATLALVVAVTAVAAFSREAPPPSADAAATLDRAPSSPAAMAATLDQDASSPTATHAHDNDQILRGRALVLEHACSGCHGGTLDPADERWMIGVNSPGQEFPIGPCGAGGDTQCFRTRPRNLTPDNTTGMGRFSERQIFNSLRFGLRPGETADVEITSTTPGVGNFPENPKYLAPPMPWPAWRHMPDEDLWAIAAYLKHGVKPVNHRVADSDGPPDFWASVYTEENMGAYPAPPFPTANEVEPPAALREQVLRGRHVVLQHDCGSCHGGWANPAAEGWLAGANEAVPPIPFGACLVDPQATPCFRTYPQNLTPHETTGTGRYTEQQIFNALRSGLKPEFAPDARIATNGAHFPS
ncbi:MAG: c-type cytochrome, partial [Longimicrobiales bacterium]